MAERTEQAQRPLGGHPSAEPRSELIDELMETYVDWREECLSLWSAYQLWSSVPSPDRALAFAAYRAALDREEAACQAYAAHLSLVMPG